MARLLVVCYQSGEKKSEFNHDLNLGGAITERSLGHLISVILAGSWWEYDEVRITKQEVKEDVKSNG